MHGDGDDEVRDQRHRRDEAEVGQPDADDQAGRGRDLLERYERDQLAALARLAEELRDTPAEEALMALPSLTAGLVDTDVERAVRAWGVSDPQARAVQARVDAPRLEFLRELWTRALGDARRARTAALAPHLIAVGASVVLPRLSAAELDEVYRLLARLVPQVRANPGDVPAADADANE